jgi:hypothetical protein
MATATSTAPEAASASAAEPPPRLLERAECAHTACYCEENALLLSKQLVAQGVVSDPASLFVVFVANPARQVRRYFAAGGAPTAEQGGDCL